MQKKGLQKPVVPSVDRSDHTELAVEKKDLDDFFDVDEVESDPVFTASMNTILGEVDLLLENNETCRDNDGILFIEYLKRNGIGLINFGEEKIDIPTIMNRLKSVVRARRKIQNDYGRHKPQEKTEVVRKDQEEQFRKWSIIEE